MKNVKPPKVTQRVPKALSIQNCQQMLDIAGKTNNPERESLLVKMCLTVGPRLSRIANIKLSDFSPSTSEPEQLKFTGKGNNECVIPMPDPVKYSLKKYLSVRKEVSLDTNSSLFISSRQGKPTALTSYGIGQASDSNLSLAGMKQPGIRVNLTRHSFALHLLNSNSSDLTGVKELLGHLSVATTQVYLKFDPIKLPKSVNDNPVKNL